MFVSDFIADLPQVIGTCTDERAYRILTRAVRLLTESALINQSLGDISICVCGNFVTLPREVETVLAVMVDSRATVIRNQWYQWHINGSGDQGCTPCGFSDVLGQTYPVIREPPGPVKLVARIESTQDVNAELRVFGYRQDGTQVFTSDATGQQREGFLVPTLFGQLRTNGSVDPIVSVYRVKKGATKAPVTLIAVDPTTNQTISVLGRYQPNETTPSYNRIRVSANNVVRVKFRRKDLEVASPDDWINLDNSLAILTACRAAAKVLEGKHDEGIAAIGIARKLIFDQQSAANPGGISPPQVINNELSRDTTPGLFYSNSCG